MLMSRAAMFGWAAIVSPIVGRERAVEREAHRATVGVLIPGAAIAHGAAYVAVVRQVSWLQSVSMTKTRKRMPSCLPRGSSWVSPGWFG